MSSLGQWSKVTIVNAGLGSQQAHMALLSNGGLVKVEQVVAAVKKDEQVN